MVAALGATGWQVFPAEAALQNWCDAVRPVAHGLAADTRQRMAWLRHGETWFAGVDVLPNDIHGAVGKGPDLACAALAVAEAKMGKLPLHPGQLSVTYPGYPRRDPDESEAAHRYRLRRDAAHLDGLLPIGPERRRMIREPHAWILGLPLDAMQSARAPLVVWSGSHEVLRRALREVLRPHPQARWSDVDVTEVYQAARREIFETCPRVEVEAAPGQAILLHRLLLHGVGPWPEDAGGTARSVVYFRPLLLGGVVDWLQRP